MHTELQVVWFDGPLPEPHVLRPPQMESLWDRFDTVYPAPVLDVAPVARPRVNVPAYFQVTAQTAPVLTKVVDDGVHEVTMRAQIDHVTVQPGEGADDPIDCGDGQTPYQRGVEPSQQTSTCTYTYRRSSASAPGQTYAVQAHAYWRVTYSYQDRDGVHTTTLGTFDVATIQRLPVQEVQSTSRR